MKKICIRSQKSLGRIFDPCKMVSVMNEGEEIEQAKQALIKARKHLARLRQKRTLAKAKHQTINLGYKSHGEPERARYLL